MTTSEKIVSTTLSLLESVSVGATVTPATMTTRASQRRPTPARLVLLRYENNGCADFSRSHGKVDAARDRGARVDQSQSKDGHQGSRQAPCYGGNLDQRGGSLLAEALHGASRG